MAEETLNFNGPLEDENIGDLDGLSVYDLSKLNKRDKKIIIENISKRELSSLVDVFYQIQKRRVSCGNQIFAIKNGNDDSIEQTADILEWVFENMQLMEKQIFSLFKGYQSRSKTGEWLKEVKGIGPTYAAILLSYLDIEGRKAAGQFHSICGLNDNNCPWLGAEKAKAMVESVVGKSRKITEDHIFKLAELSGRLPSKIEYYSYERDGKTKEVILDSNGNPKQSKNALIKGLSMIPYNKFLKKTCWLIADSFVKNRNRGSLYGKIYYNRKYVETQKNQNHMFADQAARALEQNNFKKKEVIECYKSGMLTEGHIEARARRYAVKMFISHLFEQMWIEYNGTKPPKPYILEYSKEFEHNGYIEPEVPYIW